jgi:4-alpha-glucanotransferase
MDQRMGGILLPLFSLPNLFGCGTMGSESRLFLDFLADSGIHCWQLLPLVPIGEGNSPYMSPSVFAGNPYYIDLEALVQAGLLSPHDLESALFHGDPDRIDYDFLRRTRIPLLRKAWSCAKHDPDIQQKRSEYLALHGHWLASHALFTALHDYFGKPVFEWEKPIRFRQETALAYYSDLLRDEIDFQIFLQYLFETQWQNLRRDAEQRKIKLFGDIPIYVSPDSAEVWASPELFQLDAQLQPNEVAGVPPDAFSARGQLWGNPLYDWESSKSEVSDFWLRRIGRAAELYDMVRIDHFRGFHTYWSIPRCASSATAGKWRKGPGQPLLDLFRSAYPSLTLIAEDLGDLDQDALAFISASGLPGMKILLYAFDTAHDSAYLPHNCPVNAVMYTGTHDTPTFLEWLKEESSQEERQFAADYLRLRLEEGLCWGAIAEAWASVCRLAVAPMQDVLGLGSDARMNLPGTQGNHNWSWRVSEAALNESVSSRLRHLCRVFRRI